MSRFLKWFIDLGWYDSGYWVRNADSKYMPLERNFFTGFSRDKDTWSGTEIIEF